MFQGEDAFVDGLKADPSSGSVMDALFRDAEFQRIWNYLKNCPHKTIALRMVPNLGVPPGPERFGHYDGNATPPELVINPTKAEHRSNPQELVDTILHELIHAVMHCKTTCGHAGYPFDPGLTDAYNDPRLMPIDAPIKKVPQDPDRERVLDREYGDSASNPDEEYIDINDKAQCLIVRITLRMICKTRRGRPTITFWNLMRLYCKQARGRLRDIGRGRPISVPLEPTPGRDWRPKGPFVS